MLGGFYVKNKKMSELQLEIAEAIISQYISWIGRRAHIGNGNTDILKGIKLTAEKSGNDSRERKYDIEFVFENGMKLKTADFFSFNALHPPLMSDLAGFYTTEKKSSL
jgi:hypothetical protein